MPLPEWMQTAGRVVGNVAALPLNILGAVAGIQPQPAPGEWRYPERREQALRLIPETLPIGEQMQRLEMFRLQPYRDWPDLKLAYDKLDRDNAQLMQTPEYQALYAQGGPAGLQAFGYPQPPQVLAAQDAPLSAEARARGETAPSLPFRVPQAILPPVPPEELVKRFNAETQLDAMRRAGAEGGVARATLAGVPPELADAAGMVDAFTQLAQSRGFVAEPTIDKGGVSVKLSRPGQTAFESGMGTKRSTFTQLGGGGGGQPVGGYLGPQQRPDGGVSTELLIGISDERINGGKETNIPLLVPGQTGVDRLLAGEKPNDNQVGHAIEFAAEQSARGVAFPAFESPEAATEAARSRSASGGALTSPLTAPPIRGQDSLAIENYPDATAADFELMKEAISTKQRAEIELETERRKRDLAAQTLSDTERTMLSKMIPAEAMLTILERYAEDGGPGAPSTLPKTRVRGAARVQEKLRQNETYQEWWAADPFLQGFTRLHTMGRPILARGIGDEQGNLAKTEQQVWDSVLGARSVPEVKDAVGQVRQLIEEKKRLITAGKTGASTPAPAASPTLRTKTLSTGKAIVVTDE